MTTKEDVLQYIKILAEQKVITKDELNLAYDSGNLVKEDKVLTKKLGVLEILYYIGGAIVFLGIFILVTQNWSTLNFAIKLLITLGTGVVAYFIGFMFSRNEERAGIGSAFYLISALILPIGLYVLFDSNGLDITTYGTQSLITGILFSIFFLSYLIFKKGIFSVFSIIFGTTLFFNFTSLVISYSSYPNDWKFYAYRIIFVCIVYLLLGYKFSKNQYVSLSGFLYGFGVFGLLSASLFLGEWKPNQNLFWELFFPFIAFGSIFISVNLKNKSFLTWGTLFLMVYILKITSEYFSDGLGWPISLVIAGLSMIGIGYASVWFKNKYFIKNNNL